MVVNGLAARWHVIRAFPGTDAHRHRWPIYRAVLGLVIIHPPDSETMVSYVDDPDISLHSSISYLQC